MELIAAVCKGLDSDAWVIGQDGDQPVVLKSDRLWFQRYTQGRAVVYGRKTLETFPGKTPLHGRRNLVLSRTIPALYGAETFSSLLELLDALPDDVCVIGGGTIYRTLLPFCMTAWIREIDYLVPDGGNLTLLENLSRSPDWAVAEDGEWVTEEPLKVAGCTEPPPVRHRLLQYRRRDCQSIPGWGT